MTSASLQSSDQDLNTACALYEFLNGYIAMQSTFSYIEQTARGLTECENYQQQTNENKSEIMSMMISVIPVLLIHLLNLKQLLRSLKAKHFLSLLIAYFLPCQNTRKLLKR